jgi:hypothetical protein
MCGASEEGRMLAGQRLSMMACKNVESSPIACCNACVNNSACSGFGYERNFDCSAFGLGTRVGVCYLYTDVVTLNGALGFANNGTTSGTLWS